MAGHHGAAFQSVVTPRHFTQQRSSSTTIYASSSDDLKTLAESFESSFQACQSEVAKTAKVSIGVSSSSDGKRLGLFATSNINKGDVILAMPYDERIELSASIALKKVFTGILSDEYDGWTGENGLIALMLLNEVARLDGNGVDLPKRPDALQNFIKSWIESLPSPSEMEEMHPFLWSEEDQEVLQSSSTNKVYQALDDIEEDATWLDENIFSKDRTKFPETFSFNGDTIPGFSIDGYKWAMALVKSRTVFADGQIRLIPVIDTCNHDDDGQEIIGSTMGTFGTTKGVELRASRSYKKGEEVFCSYGPKSAADYLLEHGFCPDQCWKQSVSEVTFELDPEDRFYDDKLDILEFETYEQAPLDPAQSFDLISAPGRDGEPDPAMIQFVRLCKLGATDAFLLESIFRKEVWGFMSLPVSEKNELEVVNAIMEVCEAAVEELNQCPEGGPDVCTKLRESETKALTKTVEYLQREKEALDLKEYYQERRLKDLGLDSEWSPEDEMADPDLGFGQTRMPGGADYDW